MYGVFLEQFTVYNIKCKILLAQITWCIIIDFNYICTWMTLHLAVAGFGMGHLSSLLPHQFISV
jgi:hypothetical protein